MKHMIDEKLLATMACPVTQGPLIYDETNNTLISPDAGLVFPIRDGIPLLLENEASPLK